MCIWNKKKEEEHVCRSVEIDFEKINAFSVGRHVDNETEVGYIIEDWEGNRSLDFIYFETDNDAHAFIIAKFKDYLSNKNE